MKKGGKGGRPEKPENAGPGNLRVPPPGIAAAFLPLGDGFFGGNEHAKRLLAELSLKADPFAYHPDIQAEFVRVMTGFPDLMFTDEAILSAVSKDKEKIATLAQSLEAKRQQSRDLIGSWMACAVEHFTPDQAKELFAYVVKLMRKVREPEKHRNALAYQAYSELTQETEREPTWREVRNYMKAKFNWKDLPANSADWRALKNTSGLADLADK